MERPQNLSQKLLGKSGKKMNPKDMRRISSVQVNKNTKRKKKNIANIITIPFRLLMLPKF
jgi:hypothetical protein